MTRRDKELGKEERMCIVSRAVLPPEAMIRFVIAPDGSVVADLRRRLPGRGVWVTASKQMVRDAARKKLFPKAFKADAKVADALEETVDEMLRQTLRQAIALANKAGCAVNGFSKVEAAIGERNIAALIHAQEAAPDGCRKLSQGLTRAYGEAASTIPVVDLLTGDELNLALGRSHVIHAALLSGAGSDGFVKCWQRYRDYRGDIAGIDLSPAAEIDTTD